jgi:hypothetical protein
MLLSTDAPTTLASVVIMHVLVLPVAAIVWLDLRSGARTNAAAAAHAGIIADARLELRFTLHDLETGGAKAACEADAAQAQRVQAILPLLEDLERSLRVQEVPVRIFGHEASPSLTQSFLGIWLSLETTAVSILVGRLIVRSSSQSSS